MNVHKRWNKLKTHSLGLYVTVVVYVRNTAWVSESPKAHPGWPQGMPVRFDTQFGKPLPNGDKARWS